MYDLYIATDSSAIKGNDSGHSDDTGFYPDYTDSSDEDLLSTLEMSSDYESIVADRLNVISISCILSTCILFLLLLRYRR